MGLVYTNIELYNVEDKALYKKGYIKEDQVRKVNVDCLVDSGAYRLVISEHLKLQLGLDVIEQREIELADGKTSICDVVGPVEIHFANRRSITSAFVLGNEVLLGAVPMEDLDVVIDTRNQKLMVNPENPTMPKMKIK
jgi:clan AA aspartic protease